MMKFTKKRKLRREIQETFLPDRNPVEAARGIKDEKLVDMLEVVLEDLVAPKKKVSEEIARLVLAGCVKFDRWFADPPFVVDPKQHVRFKKFVNALRKVEGTSPVNYPVFGVHSLRDELYAKVGGVPVGAQDSELLESIQTRLHNVPRPPRGQKLNEFNRQTQAVQLVIDGIRDRSLRTNLAFRVPYLIDVQELELKFMWKEVPVRMEVKPTFTALDETFMNIVGGVGVPVGASRWQTGFSVVTLELATLLDGSAYSERLQLIAGHTSPEKGWPLSFTTAFEIFHDVVFDVREKSGGLQAWIPAPRDISDLTYCLSSSKMESVDWVLKGSPANIVHAFTPASGVKALDLGDLKPLPWHDECKSRAEMYLELGETNEALFWTNVAAEAFFAYRFKEIENCVSKPGLVEELSSPKAFWSGAEDIIAKQFPNMAGKVAWPNAPIHVSLFGKLNALFRLVPMRPNRKHLLKQYKLISGKRNDLFHGRRGPRTSVETVVSAFQAYQWIQENLWPESKEN